MRAMTMRVVLGAATLALIAACSSESPSRGKVVLPPSVGVAPTPSGPSPLLYFDGRVNVAAQTMELTVRAPSGAIQSQTTLPYGPGAGKVYFHTCASPAVTYTSVLPGGHLDAVVQAVNDMTGAIPDLSVKIDHISDTGTTFSSSLGASNLYGNVPNTGAADCLTHTATWTFQQVATTSFTFSGEADGTPPVVTCGSGLTACTAACGSSIGVVACVNTSSDAQNCGTCGVECAGSSCQGGLCQDPSNGTLSGMLVTPRSDWLFYVRDNGQPPWSGATLATAATTFDLGAVKLTGSNGKTVQTVSEWDYSGMRIPSGSTDGSGPAPGSPASTPSKDAPLRPPRPSPSRGCRPTTPPDSRFSRWARRSSRPRVTSSSSTTVPSGAPI